MEKNLYIDASHPDETRSYLNQQTQLKSMSMKIKTS